MTQHTPTQWKAVEWHLVYPNKEVRIVRDDDFIAILNDTTDREANAEFIVRACNNFDALLEALRQIIDTEPDYRKANRFAKIEQIAQAAIAKATE